MRRKKRFIALFLIALCFLSPEKVHAYPGAVQGTVKAKLADGTLIPLSGVRMFRMDWYEWEYCSGRGRTRCFSPENGVEVVVAEDGSWSMANTGNVPPSFDRCFRVDFGGVAYCASGPKNGIPHTDDGRPCSQTSWCGLQCGSNPHRLEPYFPQGYQLPPALAAQGYSIDKGTWNPPFIDISVGNYGGVGDSNFVFMFEGVTITPTPLASPTPESIHKAYQQEQQELLQQNLALSPTITPFPTGFLGLSNEEFEEKIAAWREGAITTEEMSMFVTHLARSPGLQSTICNPKDGGCTVK